MRQLLTRITAPPLTQLALGFIGITLLLSGPLIPQIDFTQPLADAENESYIGEGQLHISELVVSTNHAYLNKTNENASEYSLQVPNATVAITNVTGDPLLLYTLEIPQLDLTESAVYHPKQHGPGTMMLSLPNQSIPASAVTNKTYTGTLAVSMYANGTRESINETNLTVTVNE